MATKKKKTAQPENLALRQLEKMRDDMERHSETLVAEMRGVVDAFKTEVASAFREMQMRVTTALTDVAGSQASLREQLVSDNREIKALLTDLRNDRARMDAIEERLARLERAS